MQLKVACDFLIERELKMKRIINFFKESISELKKVSWPSREEVGSSTKVVVISVVIFAAILGLVDFLLVTGIDKLFS
ncbi:MAG TPA: preprotein translocase subunit SecE [Spirochaeta sp.]|nr:preprotein translocase subunit SecE [Spirochaeta sp.]